MFLYTFHMERAAYDTIVDETIAALPDAIREQMQGVVVVIDDRPPRGRTKNLLGLYEGVPLTAWGKGGAVAELPDQITLFTQMIEQVAGDETDVAHVVRETLWHEIAHHFGFDHDVIHEMEKRWEAKRTHA